MKPEEHVDSFHKYSADIAALKEKSRNHDERLALHDQNFKRQDVRFTQLDDAIGGLREALGEIRGDMGSVATKSDIDNLRKDIFEQFLSNLKDAHAAIPSKVAAWAGVGMFLVMLMTLAMSFPHA